MPADPFENVLSLDENGYRVDSGGRFYGKQNGDMITFSSTNFQSSRLMVKLDAIETVRAAEDPQLHAVIVTFKDGTEVTYYGQESEPDRYTVTQSIPERHGGVFHDIESVMLTHCPKLDDMIWADDLTGDCHLDNRLLGGMSYDRDLDDAVVDTCRFIGDKSKLMWGKPMNVTTANCRSWLESEAKKHKRNPFLERVEAYARDVVPNAENEAMSYSLLEHAGMLAPVLEEDEATVYTEFVNKAILLGALERQYEDTVIPMAPVFIGEQGTGKTSVCRFLGSKWYKASTQDVHNVKQFAESVTGGVIVEFREGIQLMNPDTLKDFLDAESVQYRKAYDRKSKKYRIQFVTIMTTNDPNPLHDLTGARRMYPLYTRKDMPGVVRAWELTEKQWGGVWARAYHDYHHDGARWGDDKDAVEELAKKMQAYASTPPPHYEEVREALSQWPDVGNLIPNVAIKEILRRELTERSLLEAMDGLRKNPLTYGLRKNPKPFYYNGRTERGYVRVERRD